MSNILFRFTDPEEHACSAEFSSEMFKMQKPAVSGDAGVWQIVCDVVRMNCGLRGHMVDPLFCSPADFYAATKDSLRGIVEGEGMPEDWNVPVLESYNETNTNDEENVIFEFCFNKSNGMLLEESFRFDPNEREPTKPTSPEQVFDMAAKNLQKVLIGGGNIKYGTFINKVGWVSFPNGRPGIVLKEGSTVRCNRVNSQESLDLLIDDLKRMHGDNATFESLHKILFKGGMGVSHIHAKRQLESAIFNEFKSSQRTASLFIEYCVPKVLAYGRLEGRPIENEARRPAKETITLYYQIPNGGFIEGLRCVLGRNNERGDKYF